MKTSDVSRSLSRAHIHTQGQLTNEAAKRIQLLAETRGYVNRQLPILEHTSLLAGANCEQLLGLV